MSRHFDSRPSLLARLTCLPVAAVVIGQVAGVTQAQTTKKPTGAVQKKDVPVKKKETPANNNALPGRPNQPPEVPGPDFTSPGPLEQHAPLGPPHVNVKPIVDQRLVFTYMAFGGPGDYFQVRWGRPGMNEVQHKYNYGGGQRDFVIPESWIPDTLYTFRAQAGYTPGFPIAHTWTNWNSIQVRTPSLPQLPKITGVEEANGKLTFSFEGIGGGQIFNVAWWRPGIVFKQSTMPFKQVRPRSLTENWTGGGKFTIPEKPGYETDYTFKVQTVGLNGTATAWVDRNYRTKPDPRPLQAKKVDNVAKPLADGLVQPKSADNVQKPLADGLVQPKRPITPIPPKTPAPQVLPRLKGAGR